MPDLNPEPDLDPSLWKLISGEPDPNTAVKISHGTDPCESKLPFSGGLERIESFFLQYSTVQYKMGFIVVTQAGKGSKLS